MFGILQPVRVGLRSFSQRMGWSGSHSEHANPGGGAVYTPIEAIKFSSFRLRVSKWRAPLTAVWCGSCRWGTLRRT